MSAISELLSIFDQATRGRREPDWGLIMQLVDLTNKDPFRSAQFLLPTIISQLRAKDPRVVWLTLIVLDTLMKNCGPEFPRYVGVPELMHVMKKLVYTRWKRRKKPFSMENNYKNWVGERAVMMIQAWGIAFYPRRYEIPIYYNTYRHLVHKGVRFPPPKESDRIENTSKSSSSASSKARTSSVPALRRPNQEETSDRLQREIRAAEEQISLLNDVLRNLGPNVSPTVATQNDLVKEMIPKMKETSKKLQQLVNENIDNEKALKSLLELHDKLEKILAPLLPPEAKDNENSEEETDDDDDVNEPEDPEFEEAFRQQYILGR
jgi:gas vesicle protein